MTERAERRLPAIEELLASLDTCPLAVVNLDPEGRVTYWSGGAEALFGWQSEEVLGRELPTVPEDRRAEFELVHERQRRGESFAAYRTQRLRKDGSLVDVAIWSAGRFDDDGTSLGTVAYVALLEAGELADVLLGTRREEFQALVDASPLAIIAIDAEGMVTTWNAEAEALFGWSAAEALGRPLRHIPDSLRQEYESIRSRQVAGEVLRGVETRRRRKDGAEIEVAIWSASRHDAGGRFLGTLAFVADISERKQAERRDRAAHERAETLRRLSAQLASAATPQEVVEVLADQGARALEAEAAWVALSDEPAGVLRTVATHGRAAEGLAPPSISLSSRLPAAEALRTREPIWIDSREDYEARYGTAPPGPPELEACGVRPLAAADRSVGVVSFHFREPGPLPADRRLLMISLVAECERAFERALLYEEVRTTERRLRDANVLLRAVAAGMEDPVSVKDRSGRYVLANDAASRALGLESADLVLGKTDHDLHPESALAELASDRRVLETGEAQSFEQTRDLPSGPRTYITRKSPLRDAEDDVVGVIVSSTDITDRKRVEDELREAHERLSLAQGAAAAGVWDWGPEGPTYWSPEYRDLHGFAPATEPSYELWLDSIHPEDRRRVDVLIRELLTAGDEWNEEFRIVHPARGVRWLVARGRVLRDAGGHVRRFSGIGIDITERKRAEERLARIHEVTAAVAQAADSFEVGSIIVESARAAFSADGGGLAIADEGSETVQVIAFTGVPDEVVDSWRTFSRSLRLPWNEVMRTGRPVVLTSPQDVAQYPDLAVRYRQTGMSVGAYVPLKAPGRILGALSVTFAAPRSFDQDDLAFLTTLGREGAVALERARLYERDRDIAETLQRRLLPERLPTVGGLPLAARYLAGGQGLQIGGDWYDALELPDGSLALNVGDVVGHGIDAASTMGQLRTALRLALLEENRPAEAIASINRLVHLTHAGEIATLTCVVVDPVRQELTHLSAGHPPPLVIGPDGNAYYLEGGRSLPLGAVPHAQFREEKAPLVPGSTLILYTDGLIERRGEALDEGLERLRLSAERHAGTELDELLDRIVDDLVETSPSDDVAVLALSCQPAAADRLTLDLPADPTVLFSLRRSLRNFLQEAGLGKDDAFALIVATGEAAANAIEHAYGPTESSFHVEAWAEGDEVHVLVRDVGRWRDPRSSGRGRGLALMEAFADRVEFVAGEDGTEVRLALRRRSP